MSRPNTVALIIPKGGVGKTTSTFLVGNSSPHTSSCAWAVDANPDLGTLARLSPDQRRSTRSVADLLVDADRLKTAAELNAYVSRQPTGLHLLGAPRDAELTASKRLAARLTRCCPDYGMPATDPAHCARCNP